MGTTASPSSPHAAWLTRAPQAALYLLVGNEQLLIEEALNALRDKLKSAGYSDRVGWVAEPGCDWASLRQSCDTGSLFGARKLIELRFPTFKPQQDGQRFIEELPQRLHQDWRLTITLPTPDYRTRKSSWFKVLEQHAALLMIPDLAPQQLPQWLAQRLATQGQHADPATLAFLAHCVEGNLLAAHQEIQKLGLLFEPGLLEHAAVQASVLNLGRHSADDLSAALLERQLSRYALILRELEQGGVALPLVLWTLCEDWRALEQWSRAIQQGQASGTIWRNARVWGARQQRLERCARLWSERSCRRLLFQAGQIDRMIKGIVPGDPWEALLELGLRAAGPAAASAGSGATE